MKLIFIEFTRKILSVAQKGDDGLMKHVCAMPKQSDLVMAVYAHNGFH